MALRAVQEEERLWAERPTRWKGLAAEPVAPAMGMVLVKERVRASARKEAVTKGARTHLVRIRLARIRPARTHLVRTHLARIRPARTHLVRIRLARIRLARIRLVRIRLRPVLLLPAPRQQPRLNRRPLQRRLRPPVGPFLRG